MSITPDRFLVRFATIHHILQSNQWNQKCSRVDPDHMFSFPSNQCINTECYDALTWKLSRKKNISIKKHKKVRLGKYLNKDTPEKVHQNFSKPTMKSSYILVFLPSVASFYHSHKKYDFIRNLLILNFIKQYLTHFTPMSHFYNPWKRQKTYGFLTFSGGIEIWHWTKMG